MRIKIQFNNETVKALYEQLGIATSRSEPRLIKRIQAILLLSEGKGVEQISVHLAVSVAAVYHWVNSFIRCGVASFIYHYSPGRPSKLTALQKEQLSALITAGPRSCGYRTGCWSAKLIREMISIRFGVAFNTRYVATLLAQLGFSYQKARFISDHLDVAARKHWLECVWPQIIAEAEREGALLLFGDEASFAQWGSLSYTWAPRGQQPLVKTTGKRKGYKVFGLCDYFTGRLFYHGQEAKFNAKNYCDFLAQVMAESSEPLIVIQDGARYHTAKETREFIALNRYRLSVYQLPTYSPDYNPIEHVWRNVKTETTHNSYFETFEELVKEVEATMKSLQQNRAVVKRALGTVLDKIVELYTVAI